jgi:hypothetical protein
MLRSKTMAVVLFAGIVSSVMAEQSTEYILTGFPPTLVSSDQIVRINWAGQVDLLKPPFPDSAIIYYSQSPGGSDPDNYTDSVYKFYTDTSYPNGQMKLEPQNSIEISGSPSQRSTAFLPQDQKNMIGGVYYVIAANKKKGYVSNEVKVIIEVPQAAQAKSPGMEEVITSLTPTFE